MSGPAGAATVFQNHYSGEIGDAFITNGIEIQTFDGRRYPGLLQYIGYGPKLKSRLAEAYVGRIVLETLNVYDSSGLLLSTTETRSEAIQSLLALPHTHDQWFHGGFRNLDSYIVGLPDRGWEDHAYNSSLYLRFVPKTGWEASPFYVDFAAVPEPQTWAMLIVGFGMMGARLRRSCKKAMAPHKLISA